MSNSIFLEDKASTIELFHRSFQNPVKILKIGYVLMELKVLKSANCDTCNGDASTKICFFVKVAQICTFRKPSPNVPCHYFVISISISKMPNVVCGI